MWGDVEGLKERLKDWGPLRTLYWYFMTLVQRISGLRLHHVFLHAGLPGRVPIPLEPGYVHEDVSPVALIPHIGDAEELSQELDPEFLESSCDNGDVCIASFLGNKLVGFDFSSTTRAPVTSQLELVVPPGFYYSYKSWTHPDHRRKKLAAGRIEILRRRDMMAVYYVETHNYPSLLRPYRYPSARRIHMGYAGWIEVLGREYPFATRKAKWLGFEFIKKGATFKRLYTEI
jgi:hypothetical protein